MDLRQLAARLTDLADGEAAGPEPSAAQAAAMEGVRECFGNSVDPDGKAWPPLKRVRPDGTSKPLVHKGLLEASVSAHYAAGELTFKSAHPGAAVQNFGGGRSKVPARRFLGLTRAAKAKLSWLAARAWADRVVSYLRGG